MSSTATPYGLRPVRRADGLPYAGATSEYLIDSGLASNIYQGQVVHIDANGYVALVTGTGADATTNDWPTGSSSGMTGAIGVFMGCEYVNAEGQVIHNNYFPTGTTNGGDDIKCKVVDDPMVLFEAQLDGAADQTDIGANTFFAAAQSTSTGNTSTGVSTSALDATTVTTTAAFRIVQASSPIGDAFPDVLVKINPAWHSMSVDVGL
jgi:hypothetical protein